MRKSVEIVASFSGKISTGKFENESPFYSMKEVWSKITDEEMVERQKVLEDMCYKRFVEVELRSIAEKIRQQRSDMRFYDRNGKKYPSVTSIIGWDADFFISPQELVQYGARGTILHRQAEIFILTGQWLDPKDIPEVHAEYVIVTKGDLGLKLDDVDFRSFYKKHPMSPIETELRLFNDEHRYAGRCDLFCEVDGIPTMADIKTGATIDKDKAFKQMAAYCKCMPIQPEQMMIIHLNRNTVQGFSKPIVSDKIEEYFQLFLKDRALFQNRFGI